MSGIQKVLLNDLVSVIIEYLSALLFETNTYDNIADVIIEYFYDGDFIDLGMKLRYYDNSKEIYKNQSISFVLNDDKEIQYKIKAYLNEFKENEKFTQLKLLAENIKIALDKRKYFDLITVQNYD